MALVARLTAPLVKRSTIVRSWTGVELGRRIKRYKTADGQRKLFLFGERRGEAFRQIQPDPGTRQGGRGSDETISSLIFDASRQGGRGGLSGPSYPSLKLDTKSTPTMLNGTIWTHLAYFSLEITLSMRGVEICACVEIQD